MDRIDFIYYLGEKLQAESYNCDLAGELDFMRSKSFYASDHGFVLTTFDFK